jgi:hypothetical protein
VPQSLVSPRLSFARDGRHLVALDAGALTIVELATGAMRRMEIEQAIAAVGFVDQVWLVHGHDRWLARYGVDGRLLDTRALAGDGTLVAAPVGNPAAVWGATSLRDEAGALHLATAPDADLVLPLTAHRWVTISGARVVAPSGLSCELAAGSRVLGGAIVLDGAAVVLHVERRSQRELVVVGLANGRTQRQQGIHPGLPRVATRRGLVGLLVAPRELAIIDLRSGRSLGEVRVDFEISDFALDPDGNHLALREGGAAIQLMTLREALATRTTTISSDEEVAVADPEPPRVAATTPAIEEVAPPAAVARFCRPFDLRSLAPRDASVHVERAAAIAMLDHEIRGVLLWTLRAIAQAWDTRRLGYGNEGQHPFEHEVAALLGMNEGFAPLYCDAAESHLAAHASASVTDSRGPTTALGTLASELGLSALALDILLVIAAPAVWSEAARLYGILANDASRPLVDEALVEQILAPRASRHDLAAELDPRAPLVRLGIVEVDATRARPFAGLSIDPIILARARSESPDLGPGLAARGSDRALEEIAVTTGTIEGALAAIAATALPARIVVRGRAGSGRRTLIASIAAEAGHALGILDVSLLPRGDRGLAHAVRLGLRRAQLAGLLPCVVGLEDIVFDGRENRQQLVEVVRAHPGPLAIVMPPTETAPLDPGHVAIELAVLDETERALIWRRAASDAGLATLEVDPLAARFRVGPGVIHRAIAATLEQRTTEPARAIDAFIRQTRDARLGAHATRVARLASWDGLVLPGDVLDSLRELVARVRHRRTVFETWGMDDTMATSRGLTALFSGPPGTGKTLVAGVIARELGLDLYRVDLSKLMSKWLGETERNLAAIFDAAEDGQVILLFDEADSLFAKRTEVRSSNDRYANLEVNYLLQRLDTFEGIAILTTNAVRSIDPAFKRRLSFRLSFPFPDEETREQLWRAHLPTRLPIEGALALDRLAHKYQLSGGYIRNACLRAAFLAAEDAGPLGQHHLERAVALEFAELGKLSTSGAID